MKSIKLADGTMIENCSEASTSTEIMVLRDNYTDAGQIADSITPEKMRHITVYHQDGTKAYEDHGLILLDVDVQSYGSQVEVLIKSRNKTEIEDLREQVEELQEVILEG